MNFAAVISLFCCFAGVGVFSASADTNSSASFVRVSPRDPRYFELSDGSPYIPIGLNLISPGNGSDEVGLGQMERWMKALSENGGNYIRVWLSSPFWDVEVQKAGVYDGEKAKRIDRLLELAKRYGIRVKFTIEHFREIEPANVRQRWASKQLHHLSNGGTAADMPDWLAIEKSRGQFRAKLAWYQRRYADQPVVFGWELWNEMNAVRGGDYRSWTEAMLPELKRLFPRNLALQSLGSFDTDRARPAYQWLCKLRNNDAAQVHRYLDLGATLEVCRGPVDVLAADAVRELLTMNHGKPVILAESGAVEPRHTGPFKLYENDTSGIILHDVLFAPFFSGAAGAGQCWHWAEYVDRNNLWPQFRSFSEAVRGLDPVAEDLRPRLIEHPRLRIYALIGKHTTLIWCREKQNTWQSELEQKRAPEELRDVALSLEEIADVKNRATSIYDPWKHVWSEAKVVDGAVRLPDFKRSIIVRLSRVPVPTGRAAERMSELSAPGSTGYQPVPSGNLPDGTGAVLMNYPGAGFIPTRAAISVGKLPTGAGRLPAPPNSRTGSEDRILVYTRNGLTLAGQQGFVHDNIASSVAAIRQLGMDNGFTVDVSDEPKVFADENLKQYRALVFSNTNNEVLDTEEQKAALQRYIRAGGAFVGIHSACGTMRNWPWFWSMVGGTFVRHPKLQPFTLQVTDRQHPSTSFLGGTWQWTDEFYYLKEMPPGLHVLLAGDLSTLDDPLKPTGEPTRPLAWCQEFEGGRCWFTALGHKKEAYADPTFRKHLLGGILWAIGRAK